MTTARPAVEASKTDHVHRQLKAQIESGELTPGTPLSELSLVGRTGASRTPVREALRRLAAEGLVDLVPRQGARVSRISPQGVRDLFDLRALLESEAMRQAADAAQTDPRVRSTLTHLRAGFARLQQEAPSATRSAAFYELAYRFDATVVDATRNEHLRRTIADLRPHTARLRRLSHADPERIETSVVEHLRMCDAVLTGDRAEAASACADHLAQSVRTIFATVLDGPGDRSMDLQPGADQ
ncbi:transcriptional regulator, GntR family [Modestobacter sp. DSM 44400]|uniref:GntR family transcriptional regulator n=1 Tax=Modestobacter sp. DSM 44400 TaxID=1550230 RepID=UPI0008946986|nr:GntR family transcriptional regulator [Modestobacter sp. DSM 44400]SDX92267.1 transcriptional regulator, GntR family [Modestobacter sp. DSM 44400]